MSKRCLSKGGRPKAFWGAVIPAIASLAGSIISSSMSAKNQRDALKSQQEEQNRQNLMQQNDATARTLNNYLSSWGDDEDELRVLYKKGGRRKLRNAAMITDGGVAIPLGNGTYLLQGGSHNQVNESGQTGIGINAGGKEIEAEDGEVVQNKGNELRIFSAQPILNGVSPSEAVISGVNKDKVFRQQEAIKQRRHLRNGYSSPVGRDRAAWGATFTTPDYIGLGTNVLASILSGVVANKNYNRETRHLEALRGESDVLPRPPDVLAFLEMLGLLQVGRVPPVARGIHLDVGDRDVRRSVDTMVAEQERLVHEESVVPEALVVLPAAPVLERLVEPHRLGDGARGRHRVHKPFPRAAEDRLEAVVLPRRLAGAGERLRAERRARRQRQVRVVALGEGLLVGVRDGRLRDGPVDEMPERAVGLFLHRAGAHVRVGIGVRGEEREDRLGVFADRARRDAAAVVAEYPRLAVLLPSLRHPFAVLVAVVVDAGDHVAGGDEARLGAQHGLQAHRPVGRVRDRDGDLPLVSRRARVYRGGDARHGRLGACRERNVQRGDRTCGQCRSRKRQTYFVHHPILR